MGEDPSRNGFALLGIVAMVAAAIVVAPFAKLRDLLRQPRS